MTNFEMILKNPDYQHIIRKAIVANCAVSKNHLHLCEDIKCSDCDGQHCEALRKCTDHIEKWLDEEFRPVFKKEGDDA